MLCRRSPSQAWVHLLAKPPLASQLLHSAQQATAGTSKTLGKSGIQMTVGAAAPCLWSARCLQYCYPTATEGVNTWSVPPCTENKAQASGTWHSRATDTQNPVSAVSSGGEKGEGSPNFPQLCESCIACDSTLSEAGGTGKYLLRLIPPSPLGAVNRHTPSVAVVLLISGTFLY